MIKKRFISMLVLLMTAATGAWAEESETINTATDGTTVYTGTHFKITASLGCDGDGIILWNESTSGTATIESLNGENITKIEMHMKYGGEYATYTTTTAGKLVATNSVDTENDISVTDINATSVTIGTSFADYGASWVQINKFVIYYGAAAPTTYTVTLKEGTEDATNWTITPAEATTTGVAAGTEVTATYSGTKKVKSVKAVKKAPAAPALNITSPAVGQVIGSDGKNYAADATLPDGVTKVAMIAYVDGTGTSLAIALADEGSMNWETAKSTCEAKTPAFTGGTWKLPTQAEWKQMFSANGGSETSYSGLNTAIGNAGGTALQEYVAYWSSTENGSDNAYGMFLEDGNAYFGSDSKVLGNRVRACLAFTVESPAAPTLAETLTTAGMTVKVNFNYNSEVCYCQFLSNGDGTYTFQSGGGYAGGQVSCAKALVVDEDGKLVFKQNTSDPIDDMWKWQGYSVTFDTSNNTYSEWIGGDNYFQPSFISVEVNGATIAVTAAQ